MIVHPILTDSIKANECLINTILDKHLHAFTEKEILVVTSKIVSLCEGSVVAVESTTKETLVMDEADCYLPSQTNQYGFCISIKNNTLIASAGIDESNGNGFYVLWPKNPQKSANAIRAYLRNRFNLQHVGVIITDSHVLPLRWGTMGTALAYSGFIPLRSYIGKPDLFGRKLKVTNANIVEGLAASAVVTMGEGNESTPLAVISDLPFVEFATSDPTQEELDSLAISLEEDVFSPLLTSVAWQKKKKEK